MRTAGFNHVAVMTQDFDRFCAFYGELLGARVEHEEQDGPVRMGVVRIGPDATFNVFEVAFSNEAQRDDPIFQRGRLDHLGLHVTDEATFDDLRARLAAMGIQVGAVNDFGPMRSVSFRDPDGMWVELCVEPEHAAHLPYRTPSEVKEHAGVGP